MRRRPFLAALAATAWIEAPAATPQSQDDGQPADNPPLGLTHRPLRFPADHGAHPDTHVEWWYITGWLRRAATASALEPRADDGRQRPDFGFQVTFFRTRTGITASSASRFAARQLVFAHVALTDLGATKAAGNTGGRGESPLLHDQRIAREGFGLAETPAAEGRQVARLGDWTLAREAPSPGGATMLEISVRAARFELALGLQGTQPVLLQGEDGYSRKGPLPHQASHYYSEPQLAAKGRLVLGAEATHAPTIAVEGRAWLDHEWSDDYLPAEAVGWDWIGFDLFDGGALMVFRLRRADGSALWGGGSHRDAKGTLRNFAAAEVAFHPMRLWTSPRTGVRYPVEWQVSTPVGAFRVAALADDQELDSRGSTGAVYWEGLSALATPEGRTLGWGYLELTGYAERLKM